MPIYDDGGDDYVIFVSTFRKYNTVLRNVSSGFEMQSLPSVLVPRFHLCVAEAQLRRKFHSVLHAQVLLSLETLLQRLQLVVRERGPRLSLFLAESAVV